MIQSQSTLDEVPVGQVQGVNGKTNTSFCVESCAYSPFVRPVCSSCWLYCDPWLLCCENNPKTNTGTTAKVRNLRVVNVFADKSTGFVPTKRFRLIFTYLSICAKDNELRTMTLQEHIEQTIMYGISWGGVLLSASCELNRKKNYCSAYLFSRYGMRQSYKAHHFWHDALHDEPESMLPCPGLH